VDRRDNALKIPNAALRFRPAGAGGANKDAAKTSGSGGAPAKGGQGGQALRERLTKELKLNAEQQAKLEEIQRATREKIQAIAANSPEERRKQAARLRAESRVQIAAMLNEEQKARYEEIVSEGRRATRGQVWILDENGKPKSVNVRLGLSDGTHTELVGGTLKEGAEIIVASGAAAGKAPAQKGGGSPRMAF
jgi:HlyD family secretion protein